MFVYIISNTSDIGLYKIGFSKNPEKRLKQLNTGSSDDLKIIYKFETKYYSLIESRIHKVYEMNRLKGEWFSLNEKDLEKVINIIVNMNISLKIINEKGF